MNLSQLLALLLKLLPSLVQTVDEIASQKGLPADHPEVVAAVAEKHNLTPSETA
jgi:hypothetical protein